MTIDYVSIDDKKYGVTKEKKFNDTIYVFLANLDNPRDQLIKKYYENAKEELLPLETDSEFAFAMNLYMN